MCAHCPRAGGPVCWGDDGNDQTSPPPGELFVSVSGGRWHTCALRMNGSPVCWGGSSSGQASPPARRALRIYQQW